jgi:hypothetical protein
MRRLLCGVRSVGLSRNTPKALLFEGRDDEAAGLFATRVSGHRIERWLNCSGENKNPGADYRAG